VKIRESVEDDKKSIRQVHLNAFDHSEGETVSQLAIDLLEDKTALPILSLVAEQDNEIIGNVIFSSLAVTRFAQRKGKGTLLISKGIETLKERGAEIVLVYGDPNYYMRTGFKADHNLKPPHKLRYPEEAWMAQELAEGILSKTQGTVRCAMSLSSPEYW
jgi:predicted N-acetyltransferase YhbS